MATFFIGGTGPGRARDRAQVMTDGHPGIRGLVLPGL